MIHNCKSCLLGSEQAGLFSGNARDLYLGAS
jgi:hypothetical protein